VSTPTFFGAFETACGPLGPEGRSLVENTPFRGFSAGLRRSNQLAAVGGILVFGGLAAIFAELEFAGLLNRQRWAAKDQSTPHANLAALRPFVAAE
jgi:hypothetical protein